MDSATINDFSDSSPLSNKTTSASIVVGVLLFVMALLILPYHLSQLGKNNSSELSISLYVDHSFEAVLDDVVNLSEDEWLSTQEFNFGLTSLPHWLRLDVPKNLNEIDRLLLINYALLDHVEVWFLSGDENELDVVGAYRTGDAYPYSERIFNSERFVFSLPDNKQDMRILIKVSSKGPIKIPLEIWSAQDFTEYSSLQKLFMGMFFGFMVAMALSNLFIYVSTRNLTFIYYAAYVTSIALTLASMHGIGFHYLWPNNIWIQEYSSVLFASLTLIFVISLSINLLSLEKVSPINFKLLRNIRYIFFMLICLSVVLPYEVILKIVLVLLVLTTPIILLSAIVLALKGRLVARYFCAAWAVLLISGVTVSIDNLGLSDLPVDSTYLLIVGAVTESLLLAMALAVNFNEQLFIAKRARNEALNNEREAISAKDELIALQEKNRDDLEYSIEERTLELEIALRELSEKNRELEKLSAIDPLTGLMNRRFFDKRMLAESRRSRREMTQLGVAMLDIDHFKKVNDTYGHLCGDHCLQIFANVLKETIKRPSDIICRYGGEEFVLILPNTDEAGLTKLLEKVRQNIENKKILFEGQTIAITVSIGGCSRVILTEDEQELIIAFADKLLYTAKETGRNRVIVESF